MPEGNEAIKILPASSYRGMAAQFDNDAIRVWATRLRGDSREAQSEDVAYVVGSVTFRMREHGLQELDIGWLIQDWHGKVYRVVGVTEAEYGRIDVACQRSVGVAEGVQKTYV